VQLARDYAERDVAIASTTACNAANGCAAVSDHHLLPCSPVHSGAGRRHPAFHIPGLSVQPRRTRALDLQPREARICEHGEAGRALNEVDDPPVKALVVYNSNPAAVAPDSQAVARG